MNALIENVIQNENTLTLTCVECGAVLKIDGRVVEHPVYGEAPDQMIRCGQVGKIFRNPFCLHLEEIKQ